MVNLTYSIDVTSSTSNVVSVERSKRRTKLIFFVLLSTIFDFVVYIYLRSCAPLGSVLITRMIDSFTTRRPREEKAKRLQENNSSE